MEALGLDTAPALGDAAALAAAALAPKAASAAPAAASSTIHAAASPLAVSAASPLCGRHHTGVQLEDCEALYVAGTGTETLAAVLGRSSSRFLHHSHEHWISRRPNRSCFIMNLRDPVRRLVSGFRKRPLGLFSARQYKHVWHSLSDFVNAFANASLPRHALATQLVSDSSDYGVYEQEWHPLPHSFAHAPFENFLASQLFYLRGLDCATMELWFVCTDESYERDLRRLLLELNATAVLRSLDTADGKPSAPKAASMKNSSAVIRMSARPDETGIPRIVHAVDSTTVRDESRLRLTSDEQAVVRDMMFPSDTLLWRRRCGPSVG
jgi:hypothetical protein